MPTLTCTEVKQEIQEIISGRKKVSGLPREIENHLKKCGSCKNEYDYYRRIAMSGE